MNIAVTGVSGLFGVNAAAQLRQHHLVSGAYHNQPIEMDGARLAAVDVVDPLSVATWIRAVQPDLVLHAAGLTNVDGCERNPALARALNCDAAGVVAHAAFTAGAALVHISTDHIFDGTSSWYEEDSAPSPVNLYASTKLEGERVVRQAHPQAYIVRTNFYGWGHRRRQSFSDWVVGALRRGETLTMFNDVFFTPILVNDLIDTIMDLVATNVPGVYHVAGGQRLSKYAFAVELADHFGLDRAQIVPVSIEGFSFKARRPRDMSLATGKVGAAVGRSMPTAAAGIARLARLEREGLAAQLAGVVKE